MEQGTPSMAEVRELLERGKEAVKHVTVDLGGSTSDLVALVTAIEKLADIVEAHLARTDGER